MRCFFCLEIASSSLFLLLSLSAYRFSTGVNGCFSMYIVVFFCTYNALSPLLGKEKNNLQLPAEFSWMKRLYLWSVEET